MVFHGFGGGFLYAFICVRKVYFTTFTVLLPAVLFFALVLFGFGAGSSGLDSSVTDASSLFSFTMIFSWFLKIELAGTQPLTLERGLQS